MTQPDIHLGAGRLVPAGAPVEGGPVTLAGERLYRIHHVDAMPPFLMSIVSASDLWMFVSSTGGLTAGRVDAEFRRPAGCAACWPKPLKPSSALWIPIPSPIW